MDYREKIISDFEEVRVILTNEQSIFWKLLEEMKQDIYKTVVASPEDATKAHYRLMAIQEFEGKLKALHTMYTVEKAKSIAE